MAEVSWESQCANDFRAKKARSFHFPKKASSPRRRNNPHPIQDFLIYNRLPVPFEDNMKEAVRRAVLNSRETKSASALPRRLGDVKSGGPLRRDAHWIEWPCPPTPPTPPTPQITPVQKTQLIPRPHTSVGPLVRGEFAHPEKAEEQFTEEDDMNSYDYMDRILAGHLSPRKQAGPPGMPGRSYTHYNGYGMPISYMGALDLQSSTFNCPPSQRPVNYTQYVPPPRDVRPMHKHQGKRNSSFDYVHNHSIFTSTLPNVTGYYIIHPDWVSERFQMKKSRSMLNLKA